LAGSITIWIALEAVINTGVLVNLLPFAGNALPFISAGGSSLVTVFAGVGLLFGIARQSKLDPSPVSERSSSHAVVDLRRGDRRGVYPALSVLQALVNGQTLSYGLAVKAAWKPTWSPDRALPIKPSPQLVFMVWVDVFTRQPDQTRQRISPIPQDSEGIPA
jgi:hypothetical protein